MSAAIAETNRLISRHNFAVARSAGMSLTGDGMVVAYRPRPGLSFMASILGALVLLTLGKALVLVTLGSDAYGAALTEMQSGGLFDRLGALVLGVDGATAALSAIIG